MGCVAPAACGGEDTAGRLRKEKKRCGAPYQAAWLRLREPPSVFAAWICKP